MTEPDHYARWTTTTPEEREAFYAELRAFAAAVRERGEVVMGEGLDHPKNARTLGPGPLREVTEGPFAESIEQLGGIYVIDVADIETATELARLLPQHLTIEVRATVDG
ncbi:MAG: transcription initiation protein [Nocardioides sp.]|nr:transcription initiation protein [Nocardioides sp.]